jgi:hypothetical protein
MALVGGGLRATSLHRELAKRRTTRRRGNQQASFDLQIARSSERWATDFGSFATIPLLYRRRKSIDNVHTQGGYLLPHLTGWSA